MFGLDSEESQQITIISLNLMRFWGIIEVVAVICELEFWLRKGSSISKS